MAGLADAAADDAAHAAAAPSPLKSSPSDKGDGDASQAAPSPLSYYVLLLLSFSPLLFLLDPPSLLTLPSSCLLQLPGSTSAIFVAIHSLRLVAWRLQAFLESIHS
eukprot:9479571-Pyramimonas_sp.AAC.2